MLVWYISCTFLLHIFLVWYTYILHTVALSVPIVWNISCMFCSSFMCCYSKIYFAHCTVCSLMCCYILKYILHIVLALCDASMKYIFRNVRLYGSSMRCIDMKNFLWWQLLFGDFLWWQLLCCGFSHRIYSWQDRF